MGDSNTLRPTRSRRTVDGMIGEYHWGPKWEDGCEGDDLVERAAMWQCWNSDPVGMTPEEWWKREKPEARERWRDWARSLFAFIGGLS